MRPYFVSGLFIVCVAAALAVGCDINPQPEVPSFDDDGTGGESGAAGAMGRAADPEADDTASYANVDQPGYDPAKLDEAGDGGEDARADDLPPPEYGREDAGIPGVVVN